MESLTEKLYILNNSALTEEPHNDGSIAFDRWQPETFFRTSAADCLGIYKLIYVHMYTSIKGVSLFKINYFL